MPLDPQARLEVEQIVARETIGGVTSQQALETVVQRVIDRLGLSTAIKGEVQYEQLSAAITQRLLEVPVTTREYYGVVDTAGAGSIVQGTQFSITRNGTGLLTVTFNTAFSVAPTVVPGSAAPGTNRTVTLEAYSTTSFQVQCRGAASGATADSIFTFHASGPA